MKCPSFRTCTYLVLVTLPLVQPVRLAAAGQAATSRTVRLDDLREAVFDRRQPPADLADALKDVLASDPGSAEAHLLLGLVYGSMPGQRLAVEGIAEFRQALALDPDLAVAHVHLGRAYLDFGQTRRAQEELSAALAALPGRPDVMTWLAEAERRLGDADRSVALAQRALAADATNAQARYQVGLALLDLGRRDEAIVALEQVPAGPVDPLDLFGHLGQAYLEARRGDDAQRVLLSAAALAPNRPNLRIQLGRAYRMTGALDKADEQLDFAARMIDAFDASVTDGELPAPAGDASGFFRAMRVALAVAVGRLRMDQGDLDDAAAWFQDALAIDPANGRAHRYLARTLLRQRRYARAQRHAEQAAAFGDPLLPDYNAAIDQGLLNGNDGEQRP